MARSTVIEAFDYLIDNEPTSEQAQEKKSVGEMLIECLNTSINIDIEKIARGAGVSVHKAVHELRGVIFQRPALFENDEVYDITKGWVFDYPRGRVREELEIAQRMNVKFPGMFESNIVSCKKILPADLDIDKIYLMLGATWIPEAEYSNFITDLFRLPCTVIYNKQMAKYILCPSSAIEYSVINTVTYGVRSDDGKFGNNYKKQYMTAIDLLEATLNSKTVRICDSILVMGKYESVYNKEKTIEAQNKQMQLIGLFRNWVYKTPERKKRFEKYYNQAYVGYVYPRYNGDFLILPDLNPEIKLYKHQKDAVARILLSSNNTLLSHDVGAGKTYPMIVASHELKRLKLSEKNLIVVPNNVLQSMVDMHRLLYKDDNILVVYPSDFTPAKRKECLRKIRDNDYVAIYMAYSSFDMLVMSKKHYVKKLEKRIAELKADEYNAIYRYEKNDIRKRIDTLTKELAKLQKDTKECEWLNFDELKINTLIVDEAHNYKNIPIITSSDGIVRGGGSKKCREMLEKAHSVDRLIFATGTPLTNSLSDLFAFQYYLQPEIMELHNIHTFDLWANSFATKENTLECDIDANSKSFRSTTRFTSFHNIEELMAVFSQVCDFYTIDPETEGLPKFNGAENILVPINKAQKAYIDMLSIRTEKIRNREVTREEDNPLKITHEGRNVALDIHLENSTVPFDKNEPSKIKYCTNKIYEIHEKYPGTVQIVFSDIGTPKPGFNVYDSLANSLVELGIDRKEIAFIHDATSESARAKLFSDMNKGKLRVVIGSTQKLGVAVNVQEKLIALHHLSVPWRPADMVQREGRILRKGNTCEEVFIYRYITENTFDAYSWQLLENKQRFISSFLTGISASREADDISDTVLTYAEVKALAVGNPLIKSRIEIANKLERAGTSSRSRQAQLRELKVIIDTAPDKIKELERYAERAEKEHKRYLKEKQKISVEDRIAFGEELAKALKNNEGKKERTPFKTYQGTLILLPANMSLEYPHIFVGTGYGGTYYCEIDLEKTPLGYTKKIDYILDNLDKRAEKYRQDIANTKKSREEAIEDYNRGNQYTAISEALQKELKKIDKQLEDIANAELMEKLNKTDDDQT